MPFAVVVGEAFLFRYFIGTDIKPKLMHSHLDINVSNSERKELCYSVSCIIIAVNKFMSYKQSELAAVVFN